MTTYYVLCNTSTGEMIQHSTGVMTGTEFGGIGTVYTTTSDVTHDDTYATGGALTTRPLMTSIGSWSTTSITANGSSTATFGSGLPNPTAISIQLPPNSGISTAPFVTATETSGSFSLTTTVPGIYIVTLTAFPYQTLITSITAT